MFGLLKKKSPHVAIDIGASSIKLLELDLSGDKPVVTTAAVKEFASDPYTNHAISPNHFDMVVQKLIELSAEFGLTEKKIVTAVSCPSVFAKRIKVPKAAAGELAANIQFEASNVIPHKMEAITLDFQVLGESAKGQLDVLIVATKNEILQSLKECFVNCGLKLNVIDVDTFALQNAFEQVYPELVEKHTALVNIGSRYAAVNICQGGRSLFTGDIPIGGRFVTDVLMENLGISAEEAEKAKTAKNPSNEVQAALGDAAERIANDLNRQLSFFWNAAGVEQGIERVILSGGTATLPNLRILVEGKTGVETEIFDLARGFDSGENVDKEFLKEFGTVGVVAAGLALRSVNDKPVPDLD